MNRRPVVSPARTAALVVGIERYRDKSWELAGVGADARRFVRWLVSRGVPGHQILLHLAEETSGDSLEVPVGNQRVEVKILDANHATIRRSFRETLLAWGEAGEIDLAVIYWTGHGYVDRGRQRWLDCA